MMGLPARKRVAQYLFSLSLLVILGGRGAICAGQDALGDALASIQATSIRAHMRFLADDLLEGRGTGTRGHEIAAKYMATQFEGMGLLAAGDNGTYFQNVPLRSVRTDNERSTLIFVQGGIDQPLITGRDFIMEPNPARIIAYVDSRSLHSACGKPLNTTLVWAFSDGVFRSLRCGLPSAAELTVCPLGAGTAHCLGGKSECRHGWWQPGNTRRAADQQIPVTTQACQIFGSGAVAGPTSVDDDNLFSIGWSQACVPKLRQAAQN